MHYSATCPFKKHYCKQCKQTGHKEGYCNVKKPSNKRTSAETRVVRQVNHIAVGENRKFVTVKINGIFIRLQIDSASDITIISRKTWIRLGEPQLQSTQQAARGASGDTLALLGQFRCTMTFQNTEQSGSCYVTGVENLDLFGIDWITRFKLWDLPINAICSAVRTPAGNIKDVQSLFPDIFDDQLGLCTKTTIELRVKSDATPVFRPKRTVSYAKIPTIDEELQRLQQLGIITPTEYSDWAAPPQLW